MEKIIEEIKESQTMNSHDHKTPPSKSENSSVVDQGEVDSSLMGQIKRNTKNFSEE